MPLSHSMLDSASSSLQQYTRVLATDWPHHVAYGALCGVFVTGVAEAARDHLFLDSALANFFAEIGLTAYICIGVVIMVAPKIFKKRTIPYAQNSIYNVIDEAVERAGFSEVEKKDIYTLLVIKMINNESVAITNDDFPSADELIKETRNVS